MVIKKFVPPFLIIIGTIGNLLSLTILLRPRMRIQSTFLYLAGVAVADFIFLYVAPLRSWVADVGHLDFVYRYNWVCKSVCFLGGVSSHYSVWLLVLVTLERCIITVSPLKGPLVCRRSRALAAMAVLLGVVLAINANVLWTHGIDRDPENRPTKCQGLHSQYADFLKVWYWMDACIYSVLPFFIIFTLNVLTVLNARGASRRRMSLTVLNARGASRRSMSPSGERRSSQARHDVDAKRLTLMLLTLTLTFLLTTAPVSVYMFYRLVHQLSDPEYHPLWVAKVGLARTVCHHIMWTNHAVNFFLYCLAGEKFRQELRRVMRCPWRSRKAGCI